MKHELLVPVGNFESLIAAINAGADAVYLGGKKFGARAFAENFTLDSIEDATKLCHLYNVKIYIAVNTLIYESEINDALEYVKALHKIGVDALIMQDVGFINLVHKTLPNLEIHASTQMHNHSSESLKFLEDLGIKRVVFARELSLDYINNIDTLLEKEVFIHGSLCVSYSGQCLFSSCILDRSGNRGECAGMCRLPYELYENENKINIDGNYLLSPKDLCSIPNFKKLMDSNVMSFKIEGRMKSPAYVYYVTKIYRNLIDQYEQGLELKVDEEDYKTLQSIFNREYTDGFLFNNHDIMNFKAPNHVGIGIGKVTNVTEKHIEVKLFDDLKQFEGIRFKESDLGITVNFMYDRKGNLINKGCKGETIYFDNFINLKNKDEVLLTNPLVELDKVITKKIPIKIDLEAKVNDNIKIKVMDNENNIELTSDILVQKSISTPITEDRIKECLERSGNTPFEVTNIEINMDNEIFIPISKLNELRREALDKLKILRENKKIDYVEKTFKEETINKEVTNKLSVLVRTKEQLKAARDLNVENIIVLNKEMMENDLIYRIPRDTLNYNYDYKKLLVTDYASLDKYRNQISDYYLNVTNHYTLDYVSKYADLVTLSVECNKDNLNDIMKHYHSNINIEVLIYGNIELMLMKYCPLNKILNKDKVCSICKNNNKYYLKDRNKKLYRIINNRDTHSTTILNTNKTDLIDDISYFKRIGITNYRIELLDEDYNETKKIIERVKEQL